jgi:hypothetical protein
VRISSAYFAWGRVCLSVIFLTSIFALLPDLRQILPVIYMIFYITFHFFYFSTMLLIALFRMGESDYLDDNLNAEAILRKRKMIFFFYFLIPILGYVSKILFCYVFPLKRSFRWIFSSLHGAISLNKSLNKRLRLQNQRLCPQIYIQLLKAPQFFRLPFEAELSFQSWTTTLQIWGLRLLPDAAAHLSPHHSGFQKACGSLFRPR